MYQKRTYRRLIDFDRQLVSFQVTVKETDLWLQADHLLEDEARELALKYRGHIESYIRDYPAFLKTRRPWPVKAPGPKIITDMIDAGVRAHVGPMAAVAGAVAEHVGRGLMAFSSQVVVENGGDVFVKLNRPFVSAVYAGSSPLSLRIGLRLDPGDGPISICTSSGTVGHSFSMGRADAVCVVSRSCPLADAAATAICNRVNTPADIEAAIDFGKNIDGVLGMLVIVKEKIGLWGEAEIVPLGNGPGACPR